MAFISFAWTTPALIAGRKTVTRREWNDRYACQFRAGQVVDAYNRQPRFRGEKVATIRLTRAPYFESTADAPDADYAAEGFEYLEELRVAVDGLAPKLLWRAWKLYPRDMWVVRFELVEVDPAWKAKIAERWRKEASAHVGAGQSKLWGEGAE